MMTSRLGFDNLRGRVPATYGGRGAGNGYVIPIIPKTDFSFDGRVSVDQDIPVAVGVDTSAFVTGVLAVRLHSRGAAWTGTAKLSVMVQNIMLTPEEPDVVFLAPADLVPALSNTITSSTAIGTLFISSLLAMGPMVRVVVRFNQGATAAGGPQTIAIGVDLVGRPA